MHSTQVDRSKKLLKAEGLRPAKKTDKFKALAEYHNVFILGCCVAE
jgi:hypothetical protein